MKLITLGCSLAPIDYWPRWSRQYLKISEENHTHIQGGARGNKINLYLLNRHILEHGLDDTFVIWELSGWEREDSIVPEEKIRDPELLPPDLTMLVNNMYAPGSTYVTWGGSNQPNKDLHRGIRSHHNNPSATLEQVVTQLCLLNKCCKVLVFRGWSGALPKDSWHKIAETFNQHGVNYMREAYADWCAEHHDLGEDWHPKNKPAKDFFNKIFIPKLQEIFNNAN
mgnify:FL=1|tara:strand:- start:14180 stop:14854 length:675 start_codon:yes stop_codon:yes gene_type:complete